MENFFNQVGLKIIEKDPGLSRSPSIAIGSGGKEKKKKDGCCGGKKK